MKKEERLLEERWNNSINMASFDTDCGIAVAMASDLQSTRGLYASINSMVQNYDDERKLCFFVFSTVEDTNVRKQGLDCVFGEDAVEGAEIDSTNDGNNLRSKFRIIHKQIRVDTWEPIIYSKSELQPDQQQQFEPNKASNTPWSLEYRYIRYMLKPSDLEGMQRVIWIDSDTIVRGNIAELYDWDLQGRPIAGAKYWEPLKHYLCTNPRLDRIKMKTRFGRSTSPFRVNDHLNPGLLVIDLYQMHRQRILDKWHNLVISHELDCLWTESEKAFDLALNGHYGVLPNVWNVGYLGTQEFHRYNGACQKAKMLHWNGLGKPYTNQGRGKSLCVDQFDEYDIVSQQDKGTCMALTANLPQSSTTIASSSGSMVNGL